MDTVAPQSSGSEPHDGPGAPSGDFEEALRTMVLGLAPRQFAVVQTWEAGDGQRDGCVAAWGVAYEDGHAQLTSPDGSLRFTLGSPEGAVRWFGVQPGVTARIVWLSGPDRVAAA
ncbi:hypothetical protein GCM10010420_21600 [Streptomyces glaucosporus]|uniref:Uncharacterized protein n=1 Tax=Streptomyces glaucosporus TaxID=284044 RepID=A0ABN3I7L9_9ACTN